MFGVNAPGVEKKFVFEMHPPWETRSIEGYEVYFFYRVLFPEQITVLGGGGEIPQRDGGTRKSWWSRKHTHRVVDPRWIRCMSNSSSEPEGMRPLAGKRLRQGRKAAGGVPGDPPPLFCSSLRQWC